MPRRSSPTDLRDLPIVREIGVDLRAAAAREDHRVAHRLRAARRWRQVLRIGGSTLAIGAIVAAGALGLGIGSNGTKIDRVASARAAVAPDGQIVHIVMRGGPVQPDGSPLPTKLIEGGKVVGRLGRRVEQWSAVKPLRFKIVQNTVTTDGQALGTVTSGQSADGTGWEAKDGTRDIRVDQDPATTDDIPGTSNPDPAVAIARLLDRGFKVAAGSTTIDGRRVRELVASTKGASNGQGGWTADTEVHYFVDARTSAPVRIDSYLRPPLHFGPGVSSVDRRRITSHNTFTLISRLDVELYERIPLSKAHRRLFQVPTQTKP